MGYKEEYKKWCEDPAFDEETKEYIYDITIDPGHGGNDPGAIGLNKTYESKTKFKEAFKDKVNVLDNDEYVLKDVAWEDKQMQAEKERIETELDVASNIQANMLPKDFDEFSKNTQAESKNESLYLYSPSSSIIKKPNSVSGVFIPTF